jgi:hypothetical protein
MTIFNNNDINNNIENYNSIFINNDINFLKLDLSLIYMVYIHVVFFMFIFCRNLSKTRDALDSINLDNIDLTLYLKYLC